MPIFEYNCQRCHNRFEVLLRRSDQVVECPKCQSPELYKLFSTFSSPQGSASSENFCPPGGCGSCSDPGFCSRN